MPSGPATDGGGRPLNLLFISNVYPNPVQPGKGVFNRRMVESLRVLGHRVGVVCPVAWTDAWRKRPTPAAPAANVPAEDAFHRYPTYYFTPRLFRSMYGVFMWQSIKGTVRALSEQLQPDAVMGYWAHPDGRSAIEAARLAGVPSIVMTGGSDVLLLTRSASRRRLVEGVMHEASAVIAVSEDLKQQLIELGIASDKIGVIRRGVDANAFYPASRSEARDSLGLSHDGPIVVWVGRLTPVKGVAVLLEAAALLSAQHVDFQLYLVGSGELAGSLQAQAAALGLEKQVRFVGPVNDVATLAKWYRSANITVLPSLSEGIPNVLLESKACGTPFVASRVGGIPEIADEGVDRLVPPGDANALAAALREALANPPRNAAMTSPKSLADAARDLSALIEARCAIAPRREDGR